MQCHPKISAISNKLFYERRLVNGVTAEDRKPLVEGLPTVIFVDVGGAVSSSSLTCYSSCLGTKIAENQFVLE